MYVVKQLVEGGYVVARYDANGELRCVMQSASGWPAIAIFRPASRASAELRHRLSKGSAEWVDIRAVNLNFTVPDRISEYDGLPSVGTARPGSMFGGLKTEHAADKARREWKKTAFFRLYGTTTGRMSYSGPPFHELPKRPTYAETMHEAWRLRDKGRKLDRSEVNEEGWLSGVPALAFK